ncbi:hypothetical protein AMS68_005547 [Peltaster fructicola]|uniref:Protein farnesyltransferase/geranylgeranyltransferase type-1 subunit alpha n=1 Tax=Peltaster fructicola TaxID=286661 RepID=A0A6H0Y052_9PEZI|nr:hypothetical protein AMS68_005547 [Peltaster fructicola]
MGKYSDDPAWADVTPLPTDDGGPHPLAAIAYSEEYEEVSSYLRAIMAANEFSPRVLDLTDDLIELNTAHYTAWLYRAQCLFALNSDLKAEIQWLNETALAHQKNYQIWHHRNLIVDKLDSCDGETAFVEQMFELDAKNYHVWSYRQWLVKRFDLWDKGELEFTERMLEKDVRNNSAWNHRWFVINGRGAQGVAGITKEDIRQREVAFATTAIRKAPKNQSPWNYLRGISRHSKTPLSQYTALAIEFADLRAPDTISSNHALDLLADIYAVEDDHKEQAALALDLLAAKYDPIRKNFWEYKKGMLSLSTSA